MRHQSTVDATPDTHPDTHTPARDAPGDQAQEPPGGAHTHTPEPLLSSKPARAHKRSRWTKAMKAKAAEHGRRGGRLGNREGKRRGGLVAWLTRSPEDQERVRAMLRAAGGKQRNTSAKARAAQRRRRLDQNGNARVHSQAQAEFLASIGVLKSAPLIGGALTVDDARAVPVPKRGDYATPEEWHRALAQWATGRNI